MNLDIASIPTIDQVGIEERVARFKARSVKGESKIEGLKLALSMIDLTTLEGKDTIGKVKQLCYKARHLADQIPDLPTVAAVCVYPNHIKTAVHELHGSNIKVASVATAFPSGNTNLSIKLAETKRAINDGTDEIDMVISRGKFLAGEYRYVHDEIAKVKDACGNARLKVILETGELSTLDNVRLASEIAIAAGADFIKTSTGKISPAATMEVTYVMLQTISDYYEKTGRMIGMKPAGGISTAKQALQYLVMLNETLGNQWMTNEWFRFGASSLANDIIMQIAKQQSGIYYSADYISKD